VGALSALTVYGARLTVVFRGHRNTYEFLGLHLAVERVRVRIATPYLVDRSLIRFRINCAVAKRPMRAVSSAAISQLAHDAGAAVDEFNAFLGAHKVLTVDRRWVEQGASFYWSFCVDYLDSTASAANSSARSGRYRNKVDYKEVLNPEEFAIFAKLRELRKSISQQEAASPGQAHAEQARQDDRTASRFRNRCNRIKGISTESIQRLRIAKCKTRCNG
jgi:hypothetical protein